MYSISLNSTLNQCILILSLEVNELFLNKILHYKYLLKIRFHNIDFYKDISAFTTWISLWES